MNFSAKFYSKICILHEFTLKEGPKVKMENFWGWRKILEGLKRKVGIFIGTKNIFNPKKNYEQNKGASLNHRTF